MAIIKKIFFLSLFIFLLSGLFLGVYNLSFKSNKEAKSQSQEKGDGNKATLNGEKAVISSNKIVAVSKEAVISPTLSASGNSLVYYKKNSGQAYEIDFYGNSKKNITSENVSGIVDAYWSADKLRSVFKVKNPDGSYSFSSYDFEKNTSASIKKNVDEISWLTNANRIFYKYYDSNTKVRSLNVSDPDGSDWKKLTDLSYRKVSIAQIPKTGLVSFWNSGDAYESTIFESMPIVGGSAKTIFKNGFGADYLWQMSGERALISQTDTKGGHKIQLGIINYNGGEYKNLDIPTFSSKCVWSRDGKTVYYALPGGIPENAVLPNDYKDEKFNTTDTFWKVDIQTGEKSRIVEVGDIDSRYDASNMFLDQNESLLFFVNKLDGKLYRMTL